MKSYRVFASSAVKFALIAAALIVCSARPAAAQTWQVLIDKANEHTQQNDHKSAIAFGQRALRLAEDQLAPQDTVLGSIHMKLAGYYYHSGEFDKSESAGLRALAYLDSDRVPPHHSLSGVIIHLGNMRMEAADYAPAETYFGRAIAMRERFKGKMHPDVAAGLVQRAILYRRTGKFDAAETDLRRALQIYESDYTADLSKRAVRPESFKLKRALTLRGLASLYNALGRSWAAEPLLRQSLAIQSEIKGTQWEYGSTMSSLAGTYLSLGRLQEADSVAGLALGIILEAFGPNHPWVAEIHQKKGLIYIQLKQYDAAKAELELSLDTYNRTLGADHPEVAGILELLADLHRRTGDLRAALDLSERAWRIRRSSFDINALALREQEALRFASNLRTSVDLYLSTAVEYGLKNIRDPRAVADVILASKGQISDGIFDRQRSIVNESDPEILQLADRLKLAKVQVSRFYVGSRGRSDTASDTLKALLRTVENMEDELSRKSESYRARRERQSITTGLLSYMLPPRSVLVEYIRFNYRGADSNPPVPSYLVLVLSEGEAVQLHHLGRADALEADMDAYRAHMVRMTRLAGMPISSDQAEFKAIASTLYNQLWSPIEAYLRDASLVLIAPDAGLNLVSFATLLDDQNRYLIETTPIHYLSAARDIVRTFGSQFSTKGLLALADPDYEFRAEENSPVPNGEPSSGNKADIKERQVPECDQFSEMQVSDLPLSRYEVDQIVASWQDGFDEPVSVLFGPDASETRFKQEAHGQRVIHLATHGYFITTDCLASDSKDSDDWYVADHPLLLSGLLLAGANSRNETTVEHEDDGVLTAYEISAMDLTGTELVVLSACETGLGSVEEGEGVYGLRRAFQMAGAQTVISSLWAVSDRHTALFMSELYQEREVSLPERMRELQLNQLRDLRTKGIPDHPLNWGPFIASGAWR